MSAYSDYLRSASSLLAGEAQALKADGRQDEATLCLIRRNIFDACCAAYTTLTGRFGDDAGCAAYEKKLQEFAASWRAVMDRANAHGEYEKAAAESSKLAALEEISARYSEIHASKPE